MGRVQPSVELMTYTPNPEQVVALAAKLCYSSADIPALTEKLAQQDVSKLIDKLMTMNHLSPIEHVSFTFGIEGVSRSLLAQITRHRVASFSVKSQRYVAEKNEFNYIIPPAVEALGETAVKAYEAQMETMFDWYRQWQERLGGAGESVNEDARFVLPNAAETKMAVTMNARELLHFFELRCCNRAQWEIRSVAWRMLKLVTDVAPNLFKNAGPGCISGACPEGGMSCKKMSEVRAVQRALTEAK